jgi:hypothetical protein
MPTLIREPEVSITDCLEQCAKKVRTINGAGWEFKLPGKVPLWITARLKGEWLRFCAPMSAESPGRPAPEVLERMLAQNAGLPGGVKFTLAGDPPSPYASAEILLDEERFDLGTQIAQAGDGVRQAWRQFSGEECSSESHADDALAPRDEEEPAASALDIVALCKEAGWPLAERAGNQVVVELDVPGCFCQALVQPNRRKGLHLAVDLASVASSGVVCRHALSVMLLHACHSLRMTRAVMRDLGSTTTYGWQVWLDRMTSAWELENALAALSVACRISAREVSMFQDDEPLARRYLTLRGWYS